MGSVGSLGSLGLQIVKKNICKVFRVCWTPSRKKKKLLKGLWGSVGLQALKKNCGKSFTYLTKTHANLTTYSRKQGNFNGTISFEIDIMKNSSPINLNLGQTLLFHICFGCFFCFDLL